MKRLLVAAASAFVLMLAVGSSRADYFVIKVDGTTIKLVAAGAYDAGALNEQVWKRTAQSGAPELEKLRVIWTSPPFHDYHWVLHPTTSARYGSEFAATVARATSLR